MRRSAISSTVLALLLLALPMSLRAADAPEGAPKKQYQESDRKFGLEVNYGWNRYSDYQSSMTPSPPMSGGSAIRTELDYLPYRGYGKVAIGIAASIFWVKGQTTADGFSFDFTALEIGPTLAYHLEFTPRQFLVPYAKVGAAIAFGQQTGADPHATRSNIGFTYGFGGSLLLNTFDRYSGQTLDSVFGINAVYLHGEYMITSLGTSGLSHTDTRLGVRFEF